MTEPPLVRWEPPGPYTVAFSTRAGGVSEGPYASLNLGVMTGDVRAHVEENRRRLCAALGADPERLTLNRQVHSATVHRARAGSRGVPGDGLWTDEPGVPMVKLTADCLPVAVARANGARPALALLHAGWRGLLEGVLAAGAARLGEGRLVAAIGPSIGPCCYEVGDDVAAAFRDRFGAGVVRGRRLDLRGAAREALAHAGIRDVETVDLCTSCRPDLFFSHRRDGLPRGVQGVIGLVA